LRDLESMDIPAYASPDRAATAAWALVEDAKAAHRKQSQTGSTEPSFDIAKLTGSIDEGKAKEVLMQMGIATPANAVCENHTDATRAFGELQKPCVVKVLSSEITHKTEVGGVHLNIATERELVAALEKIDSIETTGEKKYLLEEMAPSGLEIIIGGKNDASFGPVVMLGLGGTAAEAFGDVAMRLAPLTVQDAMDMITELKTRALFDAWRGGPQYDKGAVADALVKIGALMSQHPEIKEMDLNPVRVYPKGVLALDALIVC